MHVILVCRLVLLCLPLYAPYMEAREGYTLLNPFLAQDSLQSPSFYSFPDFIYGLFIILSASCALWAYQCYRKKKQEAIHLISKNNFLLSQKNKISDQIKVLEENQAEVLKLDHFKESFVQMIAHDMKNPLNAIIGLSQSNPSRQKMEVIRHSGEHILSMVTNMLDTQKLKEDEIELNKQHHFMDDLLKSAMPPLGYYLENKQLEVITSVPQNLLIYVDQAIFNRILENLIFNAIKFSGNNSCIEVRAHRNEKGTMVVISITDYGEGIRATELKHVFQKYWCAESKQTGYAPSTGLGLTFCKLAIEAHGGEIHVVSEYQKFTTFSLHVPVPGIGRLATKSKSQVNGEFNSIILAQDFPLIAKYAEKLSKLEVHEYSRVNRIVKELEQAGVTSAWKDKLMSSVYQANQTRFTELVSMLKSV